MNSKVISVCQHLAQCFEILDNLVETNTKPLVKIVLTTKTHTYILNKNLNLTKIIIAYIIFLFTAYLPNYGIHF